MALEDIREKLHRLGNVDKARFLQRFFKTGPGEYGEGDLFLGISVPPLRKLAKRHQELDLKEVIELLKSSIHEERLLALLILVLMYKKGNEIVKRKIYKLYLDNTKFINNWDLVDGSAEHIVGAHLPDKSKRPLYRLARSKSLWKRRIAIISAFHFIKIANAPNYLTSTNLASGNKTKNFSVRAIPNLLSTTLA